MAGKNVLMKVFVHELNECFEFIMENGTEEIEKDPNCALRVINGFLLDSGRPTLRTCTITLIANDNVPAVPVEEQSPLQKYAVDAELLESPASIVFSKTATKHVIAAYVERRERFDNGNVSKVKLFEEISKEMKLNGISTATGAQCNTKWTSLKRTYTRIKDANNKSGNGNNSWEFYKGMDEAVGRRPENEPVATCSSTGSSSGVVSPSSESDYKCNSPEEPPSKRKKKESGAERKEAARQRRHEENMELKRKALDTLNSILASVNAKKD